MCLESAKWGWGVVWTPPSSGGGVSGLRQVRGAGCLDSARNLSRISGICQQPVNIMYKGFRTLDYVFKRISQYSIPFLNQNTIPRPVLAKLFPIGVIRVSVQLDNHGVFYD